MYEVRTASERDYSFLWSLTKTTMQGYVSELWGWDEEWQSSRFRDGFQPERWQMVLFEGNIVGAYEAIWRATDLFLAKLYILPEFQRHGIGASIVRTLIADAESVCLPLTLDVLQNNVRARRLYERLGLKAYREDAQKVYMTTAEDRFATISETDGQEQ